MSGSGRTARRRRSRGRSRPGQRRPIRDRRRPGSPRATKRSGPGRPPPSGAGATAPGPDDAASTARDGEPETTDLTLKQALRTSAFWIVAFGLSLIALLLTGLFFHQVAIFEHRGLDSHLATRVFAITAVCSVVAAPLLGRIMDRTASRLMYAAALVIMAGALGTLHLVDDFATAIAYAIVFGLANASMHVNLGYLWADYFGRRHLGSIQGTGQTVLIVGASLGPLPFSLSLDLTGDYTFALASSAALCVLVALATALFLRYPQPPAPNPDPGTRPA